MVPPVKDLCGSDIAVVLCIFVRLALIGGRSNMSEAHHSRSLRTRSLRCQVVDIHETRIDPADGDRKDYLQLRDQSNKATEYHFLGTQCASYSTRRKGH